MSLLNVIIRKNQKVRKHNQKEEVVVGKEKLARNPCVVATPTNNHWDDK